MCFTKLPNAAFLSRPGALSRGLVPLTATPVRPFSMRASLQTSQRKPAAASSSSQDRKPNPTESEEDVTADRSPVDPLHAPKAGNGQSKAAGSGTPKPCPTGQKQKRVSK